MKKNLINLLIIAAVVVFLLPSCSCEKYCNSWKGLMGRKSSLTKEAGLSFAGSMDCPLCYPLPETVKDSSVSRMMPSGEIFSTTIFAGPTLSFKSSGEEYSYGNGQHNPGLGVQAGIGIAAPFSDSWSASSAIRFKQMTASETISYATPGGGTEPSSEYKDTYTYNYVGANILAQARIANHLMVVAGPELSYLVSATRKSGGSSGTGDKENINSSSNRMGVDLLAGLKYEIPNGNQRSKWGLSLIYDHRLSRLNKKQDMGYDVPAYKMRGIQLGVAYFLR
jgi:hypothetical protein